MHFGMYLFLIKIIFLLVYSFIDFWQLGDILKMLCCRLTCKHIRLDIQNRFFLIQFKIETHSLIDVKYSLI